MKPISSCKKQRGVSWLTDDEPLFDFVAPLVDLSAPVVTFNELVEVDSTLALAASVVDLEAEEACVADSPGFAGLVTTELLAPLVEGEVADGATGLEAAEKSVATASAPLSAVCSCDFASAPEAAVAAEFLLSLVVLVVVAEVLELATTVSEVLGFEGLLSGLAPAAAVFGASFALDCSTLMLDEALEAPPTPGALGSL